MFISGIYSLQDEINHTESGLSTSAVDIDLNEYNQNNEPFSEDGKMVMPGDEISLIPRVNNLGIECYLKASITYTIDGEALNELDYITGEYSSWNKEGNYYYYDPVFQKETSIDLFNKVTIPNVSAETYQGKNLVLHIVVEAVQSKNFDRNWDNVEIKESIDRTYDINYDGESSVVYDHDTESHIKIRNNFFGNLGNMLPGDSISEEIEIKNTSRNKNKYYLRVNYNNLTDEELRLLEKITLTIKDINGNTIINSNLSVKDKHTLGIFNGGSGSKYIIELSLPPDIDNEYSKIFAKIMWEFSYDIISRHDNIPPNPKTWDLNFDLSIAIFLASALGFLIVLVVGSRDTDYIENNNKKGKRKEI